MIYCSLLCLLKLKSGPNLTQSSAISSMASRTLPNCWSHKDHPCSQCPFHSVMQHHILFPHEVVEDSIVNDVFLDQFVSKITRVACGKIGETLLCLCPFLLLYFLSFRHSLFFITKRFIFTFKTSHIITMNIQSNRM